MKRRTLLTVPSLVLLGNSSAAQSRAPLEGVWRVAELIFPEGSPFVRPGDPRAITNPEPSLIIFTGRYYSRLTVEEPRQPVNAPPNPRNATEAEKLALYEQWRPLSASAGTYEVSGSTMTLRTIVAKNVAPATGYAPVRWELKLENSDTLWIMPPPQRASSEPRARLVRLE
jgi:hypothetical protein